MFFLLVHQRCLYLYTEPLLHKIILKNILKNGYFIFGIFLFTVLILSFTPNHFLNAQNNKKETYKQLSLFGDIFERVKEQYVEEVSDKEQNRCRLAALVHPHATK